MRYQLNFKNKAEDFNIMLRNVPFNAEKAEAIQKAFRMLGDLSVLNNDVRLVKRTNKNLYFNIQGDEKKLEEFFSKVYPSFTWEEIKQKFLDGNAEMNKKKESLNDKVIRLLNKYFKEENLEVKGLEFDEDDLRIKVTEMNPDGEFSRLITNTTKKFSDLLSSAGLQIDRRGKVNMRKDKPPLYISLKKK